MHHVDLITYIIGKDFRNHGAVTYYTSRPDSLSFANQEVSSGYASYIIFTMRVDYKDRSFYLYFRNTRTKCGEVPQFSSCELVKFEGGNAISLFKIHVDSLDDISFARVVSEEALKYLQEVSVANV